MDYTYLLLLVALLISGAAQLFIKARYNAYSKINNKKGPFFQKVLFCP